jgi:hypothetical protein
MNIKYTVSNKEYTVTGTFASPKGLLATTNDKREDGQPIYISLATRPDLLAMIATAETEEKNKAAKIKSRWEGYEQIKKAQNIEEGNHRAFEKMMETGSSIYRGEKTESTGVLLAKYPQAAAYMALESMSYAAHYAKAGIANRYITRVDNDELMPIEALKKAQDDWSKEAEQEVLNS